MTQELLLQKRAFIAYLQYLLDRGRSGIKNENGIDIEAEQTAVMDLS